MRILGVGPLPSDPLGGSAPRPRCATHSCHSKNFMRILRVGPLPSDPLGGSAPRPRCAPHSCHSKNFMRILGAGHLPSDPLGESANGRDVHRTAASIKKKETFVFSSRNIKMSI